MGPLYPRMLGQRFGMQAAVDAVAQIAGQPRPELPAAAELLAGEATLLGTYDRAGEAIAAWFAAGADSVQLVLPPGRPETELAEIVDVVAGVAAALADSSVRRSSLMFILVLSYIAPLEEVDALMREHVAWLKQHYDSGRFVVSGRRVPRTGGVIVARGDDRDEIERIAAGDPFVSAGVATCEVIQFRASQTVAGFERAPSRDGLAAVLAPVLERVAAFLLGIEALLQALLSRLLLRDAGRPELQRHHGDRDEDDQDRGDQRPDELLRVRRPGHVSTTPAEVSHVRQSSANTLIPITGRSRPSPKSRRTTLILMASTASSAVPAIAWVAASSSKP